MPTQLTVPPAALQVPSQVKLQVPPMQVKREPLPPASVQLTPEQLTVALPLHLPVQVEPDAQSKLQSPDTVPNAHVSPLGQAHELPEHTSLPPQPVMREAEAKVPSTRDIDSNKERIVMNTSARDNDTVR